MVVVFAVVAPIPKQMETERKEKKKKVMGHVSNVMRPVSNYMCHVSRVVCHLSLTLTSTATDPPPANFLTIAWFAKTIKPDQECDIRQIPLFFRMIKRLLLGYNVILTKIQLSSNYSCCW